MKWLMLFVMKMFWNRYEQRLRAFWRLLIQYLFFLFTTSVALVAASLGVIALETLTGGLDIFSTAPGGFTAQVTRLLAESPFILLASGISGLLIMLLTVWLGARFLDRRKPAQYGLHFSPQWWRDLAFGLALGALLMVFIFLIELAFGWVTVSGFFRPLGSLGFFPAILIPIVTFMCVGIYEELWTRGYVLKNLAEGLNLPRLSPRVALLLAYAGSSLFFGLLHAGNPNATPVSTINLVLMGLFLGLGFILTGDLGISIGLHITWNFFQGSVFGFPVSGTNAGPSFLDTIQSGPLAWTGGAFGPEAGVIGLLAALLGCALIVGWVRWSRGRVTVKDEIAVYERPF